MDMAHNRLFFELQLSDTFTRGAVKFLGIQSMSDMWYL
jgi:hypothetical protein